MKKILWLMTFATIFSSLAIAFIAPFYVIFVENIGGNLIIAGATWAVYYIGSAIFIYFSGRMADKISPSLLLVIGFALRVLGTGAYLIASNPIHLLIIQLIQGSASALITPSYRKMYSSYLDAGQEGTEWSYPQSGLNFSKALAVLLGGIIISTYGFLWLFIIMLCSHILSFIFSLLVKHEEKKVQSNSRMNNAKRMPLFI